MDAEALACGTSAGGAADGGTAGSAEGAAAEAGAEYAGAAGGAAAVIGAAGGAAALIGAVGGAAALIGAAGGAAALIGAAGGDGTGGGVPTGATCGLANILALPGRWEPMRIFGGEWLGIAPVGGSLPGAATSDDGAALGWPVPAEVAVGWRDSSGDIEAGGAEDSSGCSLLITNLLKLGENQYVMRITAGRGNRSV